mmetsp:Transcript_47013/g.54193  ORF Transcript_47013/g.54193 Transcript_47013/m.54193 type:complete len:366 (-) Transcript_47013:123-1220(-)
MQAQGNTSTTQAASRPHTTQQDPNRRDAALTLSKPYPTIRELSQMVQRFEEIENSVTHYVSSTKSLLSSLSPNPEKLKHVTRQLESNFHEYVERHLRNLDQNMGLLSGENASHITRLASSYESRMFTIQDTVARRMYSEYREEKAKENILRRKVLKVRKYIDFFLKCSLNGLTDIRLFQENPELKLLARDEATRRVVDLSQPEKDIRLIFHTNNDLGSQYVVTKSHNSNMTMMVRMNPRSNLIVDVSVFRTGEKKKYRGCLMKREKDSLPRLGSEDVSKYVTYRRISEYTFNHLQKIKKSNHDIHVNQELCFLIEIFKTFDDAFKTPCTVCDRVLDMDPIKASLIARTHWENRDLVHLHCSKLMH